MSIWEKFKDLTKPYPEDEYDDYDEEEGEEGFEEPVEEEPVRPRRRSTFSVAAAEEEEPAPKTAAAHTGFTGHVVGGASAKQEVVLFHPVSFNDTSKAADHLRAKKAVIVNMENVDKAMARRVVDFLSGCAYAVDGKVNKIAQSTYLFCPYHMDVVGDLENLQSEVENYL